MTSEAQSRDHHIPVMCGEVLTAVANDLGVDATTHRTEDHSVFH